MAIINATFTLTAPIPSDRFELLPLFFEEASSILARELRNHISIKVEKGDNGNFIIITAVNDDVFFRLEELYRQTFMPTK